MLDVQLAFDRPLDGSGGMNFLKIGRNIWPVKAVNFELPMHLAEPEHDHAGPKPIVLRKELLRGVKIEPGCIQAVDILDRTVDFQYISPNEIADQFDGMIPDDIEMIALGHPFPSFKNEDILVCNVYDNDGQTVETIIYTDPNSKGQQMTISEYIDRFGDG